jgi:3-oxoacyl-[acyl-carrier protein] reductase
MARLFQEGRKLKPLKNQVAFVSGASRGIGAAVAVALAREGADVAVGYYQSEDQARHVVEKCRQNGVRSHAYPMNVAEETEVKQALLEVRNTLGSPDILVHSAGIAGDSLLFQDVTPQEYDRVMDIHVRGAYHLIRHTIPDMISRKHGRIILLSSIWGEAGGAGEVLYSAAKGAINAMARALAKELAPSGITVNTVSPGAIDTDMLRAQLSKEELESLSTEIPAGRLGMPEEVAGMVVYLCHPDAGYVTGQVMHINGGWYP